MAGREQAPERTGSAEKLGSLAGFVAFWESNYRGLVREVMLIYRVSWEDAEDMVEAVVEKILRKKDWDWLTGNPKAYVRTALKNIYIDRYRREQKREREGIGLAIRESHIDQGLNAWEDWEWVAERLCKLPAAQRSCMEQAIRGHQPAEIAELLGKSREAVRQNMRLARDRLKAELLGQYQIDPESGPDSIYRKEGNP